ncbi:hypothetical protein AC249_AIPGENE228 [Exaiptasia diaphana]|nr:hypothetical protein AC249_AIPGENE228 [Exaiptasia diaphana]
MSFFFKPSEFFNRSEERSSHRRRPSSPGLVFRFTDLHQSTDTQLDKHPIMFLALVDWVLAEFVGCIPRNKTKRSTTRFGKDIFKSSQQDVDRGR